MTPNPLGRQLTKDERRKLRRASTMASSNYSIGGRKKNRGEPVPITLRRPQPEAKAP